MGLFLFSAEQAAALGRAGVARVIFGAWLVWVVVTVLPFVGGIL
ncbi:hypothetical protein [Pseudooceanicola sp.]|nr:hypothetical protein [Pseudooceanicola sp.]MDF1855154.1 hypothetical protein [Pseudooceanicola sp.]